MQESTNLPFRISTWLHLRILLSFCVLLKGSSLSPGFIFPEPKCLTCLGVFISFLTFSFSTESQLEVHKCTHCLKRNYHENILNHLFDIYFTLLHTACACSTIKDNEKDEGMILHLGRKSWDEIYNVLHSGNANKIKHLPKICPHLIVTAYIQQQ